MRQIIALMSEVVTFVSILKALREAQRIRRPEL